MFNSRVDYDKKGLSYSASNSSLNKNASRTAHTSQMNSNIAKEISNQIIKSKRRKGSNNSINSFGERLSNTYYFDATSKTSNELGSLILNSPMSRFNKLP